MALRIAIDARPLSGRITGIGRYTAEIFNRLSKFEHTWFLYSTRPIPSVEKFGTNVYVRHHNFKSRGLGLLWSQTVLPYWAMRDQVDLFWSPAHRIPRFLSRKIACVVTIHDLAWRHVGQTMPPINRWMDMVLMPQAVRLADRVISVSEHTANNLAMEYPYAHDKLQVVPQGTTMLLDEPSSSDLRELNAKLARPYFLFVGTLEPRKNLSRLIDAYARLPEETREIADLVVTGGRGWGRIDVEYLSRQHGVVDGVKVLGYVTDTKLSWLYSKALFLAMPSLYEGFGLPLLEAMSRGTPVLASNVSSMPEVVGEAGVFVDPESVESISYGLYQLLIDEGLRRKLRKAALKRTDTFTWELTAQRTMDVFEQAIAARRRFVIRNE